MIFPRRFPLATLPTPLQEARALRAALGGPGACPRIFIKRDDLTGLAFGGNKARKLEFLVADALAAGATTLITTGAVQSNHARMTAAAARAAGLDCTLVLSTEAPAPHPTGNLLLDYILGAAVEFVPTSDDPALAVGNDAAKVEEVVQRLRAGGRTPYVIPIGGSSPIGALGYADGTRELLTQCRELGIAPSRLYFASGSRGTQAGLTLGARLFGAPYRLHGIAVSGGEPEKVVRAARVATEAARLLGETVQVTTAEVSTAQEYYGDGYGIPTPEGLDAITLLARTEAILLDPTYTGKAMAGLIDQVRRGLISPGETIVFLHTGGTPALFAHADAILRRLAQPAG